MAKKDEDEIITTGEAGKLIGKHRSTIVRYIEDNLIPGIRAPGGWWGVYRSDVLKLIQTSREMHEARERAAKKIQAANAANAANAAQTV
jgi:excisionase family DNA binding protein